MIKFILAFSIFFLPSLFTFLACGTFFDVFRASGGKCKACGITARGASRVPEEELVH